MSEQLNEAGAVGSGARDMTAINEFVDSLRKYMWGISSGRHLDGGFANVSLLSVDDTHVHLLFEDGHEWRPEGSESEWDAEYEKRSYVFKVPLSVIESADMDLDAKCAYSKEQWRQTGYYSQSTTQRLVTFGATARKTVTDERTYLWPDVASEGR